MFHCCCRASFIVTDCTFHVVCCYSFIELSSKSTRCKSRSRQFARLPSVAKQKNKIQLRATFMCMNRHKKCCQLTWCEVQTFVFSLPLSVSLSLLVSGISILILSCRFHCHHVSTNNKKRSYFRTTFVQSDFIFGQRTFRFVSFRFVFHVHFVDNRFAIASIPFISKCAE